MRVPKLQTFSTVIVSFPLLLRAAFLQLWKAFGTLDDNIGTLKDHVWVGSLVWVLCCSSDLAPENSNGQGVGKASGV